jgi:methylenetetrahydrofolate--tRNA-(uracil-5-)-methyltransferase
MVVNIIGGGLAGTEAAYQLSKRGIEVNLYEMRPKVGTDVHKTGFLAELVCSNSLKSLSEKNAVGILKNELLQLDSLVIKTAFKFRVPAGKALAVDREKFSKYLTDFIEKEPNIHLIREEIKEIDLNTKDIWIVATGPLTSENLFSFLNNKFNFMHFFDAVSPIITKDSIDFSKVFYGSRYGKGGDDYINCPMTKEEYERFYSELVSAEVIEEKDFEKKFLFERCQPIENIAKSGIKAMSFGPLKPVGFTYPNTNKRPYAIVQLRPENLDKTLYELVGFQTRLRWPEQKRVFRLIP